MVEEKILEKVELTAVNGGCRASTERIIRETPLSIHVDGRHVATAMIMASMEKEYVTGYLFGQGMINSANDIESIDIEDNNAGVTLRKTLSGKKAGPVVYSTLVVRKEDVFDCLRAILKSDIFEETEAVHSAGLFLNGSEAICIAEDLGRHHALDKVIGYGLMQDIDFGRTLAASTGRQPSEMILKYRNAGIPIVATKGVPTTLAVEMAKEAGISIAGLVRGDTMVVYSTPARIV